jgi:hypothetical protein
LRALWDGVVTRILSGNLTTHKALRTVCGKKALDLHRKSFSGYEICVRVQLPPRAEQLARIDSPVNQEDFTLGGVAMTKYRSCFKLAACAVLAGGMLVPITAQAMRVILEPTAISSPQGSFTNPDYGLPHMIDQSGLAVGYVSGTTGFDTYVPATLHSSPDFGTNSGFTNSSAGVPQTITFDLGSIFTITGIGFWATGNTGSVTQFRLFADTDADFGNGNSGQLDGTFNALAGTGSDLGQVFDFAAVSTEFVHLIVLNMAAGSNIFPGIGEIAFASATPEPATLALFGLALAGLGFSRRKQI